MAERQWILQHTDFPLEKVIFCLEPEDKAKWAEKSAWLIDDRKKSLEPFESAGGNVIEFKGNWKVILNKIEMVYSEGMKYDLDN